MSFSLSNIINIKTSVFSFILIILVLYSDKYFNYYEPHMNGRSSYSIKPVVQQYRRFIEQNQDLGSSLYIYNNSISHLDLISGYEDLEFKQKWSKNTITQVFSLSHIVGVLSMAVLVERGLLSYEGKLSTHIQDCHVSLGNKTLSDILMHKAGFPYLLYPISLTDYRDDSEILFNVLLSQPPLSSDPPIFHKYTQGFLLDYLVRKVDPSHRSLSHFFTDEITRQLKIDLFIGLPRTQLYRTARIYQPTLRHYLYALGRFDFSVFYKYLSRPSFTMDKVESSISDVKNIRDSDILEIGLSSWNVFSNADSITTMLNAMVYGSSNSQPMLRKSTIDKLCEAGPNHYSEVIGSYVAFTKGGLMSYDGPKKSQLCGWRDETGQFVWTDRARNITFGYVTNHIRAISMEKDFIASYIISSIYDIL